jgi:hypothetical protein
VVVVAGPHARRQRPHPNRARGSLHINRNTARAHYRGEALSSLASRSRIDRDVVGDVNENTLRADAVCFFNIAAAAGLGTMTVGRGGQATRLKLDKSELTAYIEGGPSEPSWQEEPGGSAEGAGEAGDEAAEGVEEAEAKTEPPVSIPNPSRIRFGSLSPTAATATSSSRSRSCSMSQASRQRLPRPTRPPLYPVPEKVLNSMRRCGAGIIAVTVDEGRKDDAGNDTLNENVPIEIGAAFVLYDRRVVLLWDKRLTVPSNVQGLYRCEFEGDELSWTLA